MSLHIQRQKELGDSSSQMQGNKCVVLRPSGSKRRQRRSKTFSDESYFLHMSVAILSISTLIVALMLSLSFRPRVVVLQALREEDSSNASGAVSVDETTVSKVGEGEANGASTVHTAEETMTIITEQLLRPRQLREGGTNEPPKPALDEDGVAWSSHEMGRRIVRRRLVEAAEETLDGNKDDGIDSTQTRQNLFAQAKRGPVSEVDESASDAPSLFPSLDPSSPKATGAPSFFRESMSSPSQEPSNVGVSPSPAPSAIVFVSGSPSPSGRPSSPPSSAPSAKTVGGGDAALPPTKGEDFFDPSSSPTTKAQLADSLTLSPPAPKDSATEQKASAETALNQDSSSTSHAIPAIMVGLASSVVFCALFLYCADARDKRKHNLWLREQREIDELPDDNSSEKSLVVNDDNEGGRQLPACAVPTFDSTEQSSDGSNVGSQGSGYWIHAMMKDIADYNNCPSSKYTNAVPPPNMLPPLDREGECNDSIEEDVAPRGNSKYEDLSISRVSTLTTSVMEESLSPPRYDADVDGQGAISSLLRQSRSNGLSDCSSLTDGSVDDITGVDDAQAAMLLGEQCLTSTQSREAEDGRDDSATGEAATSASDARDDEEMDDNDDYAGDKADLSQQMRNLEELIASINPLCAVGPPPLDLPTLAEEEEEEVDQRDDGSESRHGSLRPPSSSKREIFFVPPSAGGKGTIGLTFKEQPSDSLSHPIVSKVEKESTFTNRIFPGDAVLAVDDLDTVGLLGSEVVNLMVLNEPPLQSSPTSVPAKRGERTIRMIKLTVMGRGERQKEEYTADSSSSSNGSSTDFGTVGGREEV